MSSIKNIFLTLTGMAVLTACSAVDIDKTRKMPSKGTAFQQALHKEYAELAFLEDDEGDSDDAVYFNNKAVMSAAGNKVGPQKTKERNLPGDTKWVLEAARSALVAELGSGARDRMPAKAARAQAMFDCWMQEQEENNQPKDIARCRSAFDRALKDIGKVQVASAPPAPVPGPYTIFFAFDSAKLDAKAMAVIKKAAGEAQAANISGIILNAHTDRAGTNKYNEQLSRARLDVVGNALSAAGVSLDSSIRSSLGENFPAVSTPDGKREPKNRRVEIKFRR